MSFPHELIEEVIGARGSLEGFTLLIHKGRGSEDKIRSLDANEHIAWVLCELAHCTSALHRYLGEGYDADIVCACERKSCFRN